MIHSFKALGQKVLMKALRIRQQNGLHNDSCVLCEYNSCSSS